MITLKYPFKPTEKDENLKLIADYCRRGCVIIYPTETFYAIGGNALDPKLGDKLSKIKKRAPDKPFPTLVGDCGSLKKLVAFWSEDARKFADKYWPGALTMVLPGHKHLPEAITASDNTVAVRWSSHPFINEIAAKCRLPLISTSANLSSSPPTQTANELDPAILKQTDLLIIQDSRQKKPQPSTIIDPRTTPPLILRPGAVEINP